MDHYHHSCGVYSRYSMVPMALVSEMKQDIVDGKQGVWVGGTWNPHKAYLVYMRYYQKYRDEYDTVQEAFNAGKLSEDYGDMSVVGIEYDGVLYKCSPIMGKYGHDNDELKEKFGIDVEPYDDD